MMDNAMTIALDRIQAAAVALEASARATCYTLDQYEAKAASAGGLADDLCRAIEHARELQRMREARESVETKETLDRLMEAGP